MMQMNIQINYSISWETFKGEIIDELSIRRAIIIEYNFDESEINNV